MDVFYMTYVKNTTVHKLKKKTRKKHPVYEDKSGSRRKVVIVRGKLIGNFRIRIIFDKCWYILYYCGPTMDKKKILLKY